MTTHEYQELAALRQLYRNTPIRNYTPAMREGGARWTRHEALIEAERLCETCPVCGSQTLLRTSESSTTCASPTCESHAA